jgi:hypothetical protein
MFEPVNIEARLNDPSIYEQAILKIFANRTRGGQPAKDASDGVSYYRTAVDRQALAGSIAKTVAAGEFQTSPVEQWFLERHGKIRPAHGSTFVDQVVGSVLFQLLTRNAQAYGMRGVYSYLPGYSNASAALAFSRFLRRQRKRTGPCPSPLYVVKSDFHKFGETLPVGPQASLWNTLRQVADLGNAHGGIGPYPWSLIVSLARPVVRDRDGALFTRTHGVSMGTPLTPLVSNLSVRPMDEFLNSVDGLFYARYNDDFLFAHADLETLKRADAALDPIFAKLGVTRKLEKESRVALSGTGRPSSEDPRYRGSNRIDFLGISIAHDGDLSPAPRTIARFVARICVRIDGLERGFQGLQPEEKACHLVSATNVMLDASSPFAVPGLATLLRITSNRGVLKDIDFRIARKIAQAATGRSGNIGFRRVSPTFLRSQLGLVSLVRLYNLRR